ncbi:MAG: hypothetical protein EBR82_07405 [Caulobacteraceae bacterium]|nr:hypothetical protein [Caulobacteraceae bacterium]
MTNGEVFLSAYPRAMTADYVFMVEKEANHEMERRKIRRTMGNIKEARETAEKRIQAWADESEEYNIERLSTFVASHRPACVWAVLIGREAKESATNRRAAQ